MFGRAESHSQGGRNLQAAYSLLLRCGRMVEIAYYKSHGSSDCQLILIVLIRDNHNPKTIMILQLCGTSTANVACRP